MKYFDPRFLEISELNTTVYALSVIKENGNSFVESFGEPYHAVFEWVGDSPYVVLPLNGLQQAMNAGFYSVTIPTETAHDLLPGMEILVGQFQLCLLAFEAMDNGRYLNGIFERLYPPLTDTD